jgi:tetratricopeptide (TPR) repeat protein
MMLSIFISYAHRDEPFLKELEEHLALLQNQRVITTWHDRDISAGAEWEREIDTHLNTAHIILLLISASFLASKYCYSTEMKRAIERHKAGEACVIPVILRPVDWKGAPFGRLQALPTKAQPITSWSDRDEAFFDVAKGIRDAIEKLMIRSEPRKIALFGYETLGGKNSVLWSDPSTFSLNETYLEWLETKKDFTDRKIDREIVNHTWVKAGDHGYSFTVHFLPHGQLQESPLLDPARQLQGSWQLIDGVLRTTVEQDENDTLVRYELDIFANRKGFMHSGIESRDNRETAHAYFVFLPSQQPTAKHLEEGLSAFDQLICVDPHCVEAYKAKGNILRDLGRYKEALDTYQRAIELKPDYMWAWYDKGDILHKLKRYEEAAAAFGHAIELDGQNAWAWYEKGQISYDLKRYKEALPLYERAIEIDPNNAWFWHRKGETLRELRRYEEALTSYGQALKVDPKFAKSYNGKGNVLYRNLKRYEEAIAAYQRATELEPNYMWAWHNLGNVLHELRRFEDALIAYRRTTEIDPSYFWAWHNMGDVLHTLGRLEEALDAFDQAIKRDDSIAATWREKGKTLQDLKRYEEALFAYERVLGLEPHYVSIWTRKGEVLCALKRYQEALGTYEQALLRDPDSASSYEGRGWQLYFLGQYEEALDAYEEALLRDSDHAEWYNRKAIVLRKLGRREEALTVHEKAIELAPEVHHLYIEKGITLRDLKGYKEALAAFERALQLNPNSAHAHNERGMAFRELGEYEKALTDVKKAIDLDPGYMYAYREKGITFYEYGHRECNYGYYEEAIVAFDQAIDLDPDYADTYARKGDTLYELKKYEEALDAYERAQEREDQPVSIWVRKGEMLYALERYQHAKAAYETALLLDPKCIDAYLGLGRVYLRLKSYEEALAVYEQATKVAPDNTWTWHDKGEALSRLGHAGDALMAFEQAIALDSTNKWAWRHKSEALEQLAQQAAQRAKQLFGEEEQSVSEVIDESIHRVKPDAIGTAIYSIISEFSDKVLDIQDGTQEDGTAIIQYHYHGGPNQQWELVPVEENYFKIVSCLNGKALDVWNHNSEDGAEVVLHRYLGGANQHWQLVLIDSASFTFKIISQESGKVLDVWNYGREDGTKVVLHSYLGGANQHWRLVNAQQWNEELDSELVMSLIRYNYHDASRYIDEVRNRLGPPITPIREAIPSLQGTTGWVQHFAGVSDDPQRASVYRSKYGTYPIWGEIERCYEHLGETASRLGFPISPELSAVAARQGTTGQVQRFEGNGDGANVWDEPNQAPISVSIYSSKHGTYPTWGEIGRCYERLGGTSGRLGFPTSPELQAIPSPQGTTGQVQRFEDNASVYYSGYGAYPTWGGIGRCYEDIGGTSGPLGFPTSSEQEAIPSPQGTTGWIQHFEGGDMYWTEEHDGVPVMGPILTLFEKSGGSGGEFGFPKLPASPEPVHSNHYIQEFEGGVIQSFD